MARRCSVEGCGRPHCAKGFCNAHWKRSVAGHEMGRPLRGTPGYVAHGCTPYARHGYKFHGGDYEHRIVTEKQLGRFLRKGETVHHKNGDRLDNRPQNLELWSTAQPKGQRVADKVAWAREILAQYADDELNREADELFERVMSRAA